MYKRVLITAAGMMITTSLLCGPLAATPANATTTVSATTKQAAMPGDWSASAWRELAERARTAGDAEGAAVSRQMADRLEDGAATSQQGARNIWTTIAKKAVIQALRYGVNKLPAKIRPYANRIINVVEDLDQFQQGAVVLALTKAGVPYDVAVAAAQWIVVFIGL